MIEEQARQKAIELIRKQNTPELETLMMFWFMQGWKETMQSLKPTEPCIHDWEQNIRYDNVFSCKLCGEEKSFYPFTTFR